MINTSAPLFNKDFNSKEIEKQNAELYSKLYAYGAEDFVSHPDMKNYVQLNNKCIEAIQKQISQLMKILSTHTHRVPPHTHQITPHYHISPESGAPTSPNLGGHNTLPTLSVTEAPVQSSSIRWTTVKTPSFFNTTGASTNLEGNKVIIGPSKVGPVTVGKRRAKVPAILNTVSLLPIIKANNLLG